jgi:hypothetical protein
MGFAVAAGRITSIDCLLDPERLAALDVALPPAASAQA